MTDGQAKLHAALERLSQEDQIALQDLIARACDHLGSQPRMETVFDFLERHNPQLLDRWLNEVEAPRTPPCATREVRTSSLHIAASCHARLKLLGDERHERPTYRALCGFRSTDGRLCSASVGSVERWNPVRGSGAGDVYEALRLIDSARSKPLQRSNWLISAPMDFPGFIERDGGYYEVIRPRLERDRNGNFRRRTRGRREMPGYLWETAERSGMLSREDAHRDMIGSIAPLPSSIKCHLCGRMNLVAPPE